MLDQPSFYVTGQSCSENWYASKFSQSPQHNTTRTSPYQATVSRQRNQTDLVDKRPEESNEFFSMSRIRSVFQPSLMYRRDPFLDTFFHYFINGLNNWLNLPYLNLKTRPRLAVRLLPHSITKSYKKNLGLKNDKSPSK